MVFSKFFLNAVFPTSPKKLKLIFSSMRKSPYSPQMTSSKQDNYIPEPAWDNIKAFMMPEKHELPLFPHPTAWALTESGLNWYAPHGNLFYHNEERFQPLLHPSQFGEHPDLQIATQRLIALENWLYDLTEDEFGGEIGFGADPDLQQGIEELHMVGGL